MRLCVSLLLVSLAALAQDQHDWQSLAQLHPGDRLHVFLKTGDVDGEFQASTPQDITVGTVTTKKEDVIKIERYRVGEKHGMGRGKKAAIGALIGFGGGFAIGALVRGSCTPTQWCFVSRGELGVGFGGAGAIVGAAMGALIPSRHGSSKETIYSIR